MVYSYLPVTSQSGCAYKIVSELTLMEVLSGVIQRMRAVLETILLDECEDMADSGFMVSDAMRAKYMGVDRILERRESSFKGAGARQSQPHLMRHFRHTHFYHSPHIHAY